MKEEDETGGARNAHRRELVIFKFTFGK